jgi:hypothetical protein
MYEPVPEQKFPGLPLGMFGVGPATSPAVEVTISAHLKRKVRLTQFPVSAAFALTCHRCQGSTLRSLVVLDWSFPRAQCAWIYVALIRVGSLGSFTALIGLPEGEHVNHKVDSEMRRLRASLFAPSSARLTAAGQRLAQERLSAAANVVSPGTTSSASSSSASASSAAHPAPSLASALLASASGRR